MPKRISPRARVLSRACRTTRIESADSPTPRRSRPMRRAWPSRRRSRPGLGRVDEFGSGEIWDSSAETGMIHRSPTESEAGAHVDKDG